MFSPHKFKKKYTLKVPKNIKILYCDKKNIIIFVSPSQTKSLELKVKVFLTPMLNLVTVTNIPIFRTSASNFKNVKKIQGMTVAKIKQRIIEVNYTLYRRLRLVGVGYRGFSYEQSNNQIYFKLGYSHLIYFKIPNSLKTYCHKFTDLFIFGNSSFDTLTQTAAQIKACRTPEPYKGKGILYDQEKIILKKGKKI